jgi:hypothetical protein
MAFFVFSFSVDVAPLSTQFSTRSSHVRCTHGMLYCRLWCRCVCGSESDSQDGNTALMYAAEDGHADCVRLLIDAGADKNIGNNVRVSRCIAEAHYFISLLPSLQLSLVFINFFFYFSHQVNNFSFFLTSFVTQLYFS